jgi:predicted ferric reductase
MNKKYWRWFYPGVAAFIFLTLLITLLIDFVPGTAQVFVSTTMGMISYSIMLALVLIAVRPKAIEKKLGLTDMYEVHAWMAMALPVTLLLHVGIRWSGLERILTLDLSPASMWGYAGLITLILVMLTGIFVLSDTIIKNSKKLMDLKQNYFKRNTHLWIHRLAIVSIIAIFFHIFNVNYLAFNVPFRVLTILYTAIVLGWYAIYKIRIARLPRYEVVELSKPSPRIHEIVMAPVEGDVFDYQPGQYGFFRFVDSEVSDEAHPFSFSSAPSISEEEGTVRIMAQEDGDWTSTLDQLKEGDKVTIEGPYGDLYTEEVEEAEHPLLLLSGGIGVTPNLSILREEVKKNSDRRIAFVWGVGYEEELMFYDELEKLVEEFPNFSHHVIFSEEEVDGFPHGFVDDEFIADEDLEEMYDKATWHVCGPPPMLAAAKGLMNDNGVTEEQQNVEEFAF